jgi:hypothetical protein
MGNTSNWLVSILLVGSLAAMAVGRSEHQSDLEFGGFAALLLLLGWFAIYRKQRAARDPVFAAKMEQIDDSIPIAVARRNRRAMLKIMVPALLASLPIWLLLRMLQPTNPTLTGLSDAAFQRIAIAAGIVIALAGYGMFRLLHRGDSGNG